MADKIRLLPEVVANQIAAGEVVNRPSSVVREMMENAIDAGARSVKVNFRDGGKDLIQIVDDGCGMSPIDARMAFDRHATSKIASVDDIYALHTFGFRGEALASIAAVAQGGAAHAPGGRRDGNRNAHQRRYVRRTAPRGVCRGVAVFVRNLFLQRAGPAPVPRKKTTSATQIRTEFQRVALCNPKVHFRTLQQRRAGLQPRAGFDGGPHRRCDRAPHPAEPPGGGGRHVDRPHRGICGASGGGQETQQRAVSVRQWGAISAAPISPKPF